MSFTPVPPEEQSCRNCYYARPVPPGVSLEYLTWMHKNEVFALFSSTDFEVNHPGSPPPVVNPSEKANRRSCRYSPPVTTLEPEPWPEVSENDWCGHWAMAEPKREPG
jgi:hypothetical protein